MARLLQNYSLVPSSAVFRVKRFNRRSSENKKGKIMTLRQKTCVPCERGAPPLTEVAEAELLRELSQWDIDRSGVHRLVKRFSFSTFMEAVGFVNSIAIMAEDEGHHPSLRIDYRKVTVELTTHAVKGLSENDFIMAAKIDRIYAVVQEPQTGVFESAML
jgi:4a-hydroxytetrahydrobiopterin dehydratase